MLHFELLHFVLVERVFALDNVQASMCDAASHIFFDLSEFVLSEDLVLHVESSWRGTLVGAFLRTFKQNCLVDEEITICHAWYLLAEYNWVILEVVSIVLVDKVPIDSFDLDVNQILKVSRKLELVLVNLRNTLVLI